MPPDIHQTIVGILNIQTFFYYFYVFNRETLSENRKIIKGCLSGSRRDQELLYRRHSARLYAVCMQYSGNDEEAKDILQDGFIKIFENLHLYKHEGSFEGWLRRIVVNTALERYRRRNHLYRVDDIDSIDEPEAMPDTEDYAGLQAIDLLFIIRGLPPKYRMVFNLYAIEGYKHREIAKMLDITVGTSKSQLSKARKMLQGKVNKQ